MFFLTQGMLEHLKCYKCRNYLSATPIKVYPNREIKCNACSVENDGGVVSSLFEKVADHVLFPCIHQNIGCEEEMAHFQTAEHESRCTKTEYCCPICAETQDSSYNLDVHMEERHPSHILKHPGFTFKIDESDKHFIYYYAKGCFPVTIYATFNWALQEFGILMTSTGDTPQRRMRYTVYLKNVKNGYRSATTPIKCTHTEPTKVTVIDRHYPRGVVSVIFTLSLKEVLKLPDPKDYLIFRENNATITWKFTNMEKFYSLGELSSTPFFVYNVPWRITVKMNEIKTNLDYTTFLGVYLKCDKNFEVDNSPVNSVLFDFTLLSCITGRDITKQYPMRVNYNKGNVVFGIMDFVEWRIFQSFRDGYIKNCCFSLKLNIDVKLKNQEAEAKDTRCLCKKFESISM